MCRVLSLGQARELGGGFTPLVLVSRLSQCIESRSARGAGFSPTRGFSLKLCVSFVFCEMNVSAESKESLVCRD